MDQAITTLVTNAGVAGAVLVILGWAYWKKDRAEKSAQVALVKQAEKHGQEQLALQSEFIEQLKLVAHARTEDAQRFVGELMKISEANNEALSQIALTNVEVKAVLIEIRRDIRDRNRKRSSPGFDPSGG